MQAQAQQLVESTFVASQAPAVPTPAKAKVKPVKLVERLHRTNLKSLIEHQDGKFVSVDFEKLSGEKRTLTGRLGVTAFLKGGSNNVEADFRPYLTIFDIQLREYRTVSLDTVRELRAQNRIYSVFD